MFISSILRNLTGVRDGIKHKSKEIMNIYCDKKSKYTLHTSSNIFTNLVHVLHNKI